MIILTVVLGLGLLIGLAAILLEADRRRVEHRRAEARHVRTARPRFRP